MSCRYLLSLLALAVGYLGCNSTGSESTKPSSQPLPVAPVQGPRLEAKLGGRYVEKLQIQQGDGPAAGPNQPLSVRFQASGMNGVKQFELVVALEPVEAFELEAATFTPEKPFITVGSGVEVTPEKNLRSIGIFLDVAGRSGDGALGTLNLKTSSTFSAATRVRIRVLRFSIGPSSRERDTYAEQELNLGVVIGP